MFVFIFCLIEFFWIYLLPMVNIPPVWRFIYACTSQEESAYQYVMVIWLIFDAILSSCVSWIYLIIRNNSFHLSLYGTLTLVHINDTVGWISVLYLLYINNALTILVWNTSDLSESIYVALWLTVNKYFAAGVFTIFIILTSSM